MSALEIPSGPAGATGPAGAAGATGPAGPGVAAGGTTNQVLAKTSGTDYATAWVTPAAPGARVWRTSAGGINHSVATPLPFDAERFDIDAMHNPASNSERLTVHTAGIYTVSAFVTWAGAAGGGYRSVSLRLNGSSDIAGQHFPFSGANPAVGSVATVWSFAVNDYVEVVVYQDSGALLNVDTAEFAAARVG